MNKTVLLATLMLAPAVFVSAQDIKVNATGSVDNGVVNVEVTTDKGSKPVNATWDLATGKGARTTGEVNVNVDVAVPTVDMAGVVTTMTESTSTPTTTAEMVVDAEVTAVETAWDAITTKAQENTGSAWTVVDATIDPATLLEGETVQVKSIEEVSLFGFFKFGMTLTAEMDVEGNVTNIEKPWFAMFAW